MKSRNFKNKLNQINNKIDREHPVNLKDFEKAKRFLKNQETYAFNGLDISKIKSVAGLRAVNNSLKKQNKQISSILNKLGGRVNNALGSVNSLVGSNSPYFQAPITSFTPALQNNIYAPFTIDWTILIYMYKTHGVIQTLCDMPVLDAFRGGINIKSKQLSSHEIAKLQDIWEHKGIEDVIMECLIWNRLFGGSAMIVSTNDYPQDPLDYRTLANSKRVEFYAANRWELYAPWRYADHYGFYGESIDATKVLTMIGKQAPWILRWQLAGWGMSELERVVEDFNTYIRVKNVIYAMLWEAKIDVFKFKDYAAQLLSGEAAQNTNNRLAAMNATKNYNSALLMDSEDVFEQKQLNFSGVAEVYNQARLEMAACLRMPLTKIWGMSATGFNSGEDDIENYNGLVETEVRRPARKIIRKILEIICVAYFGDTYDIDFDWKPLRVLGEVEQQNVKNSQLNRIMALYDRGLISSDEVGMLIKKEGLVGANIDIIEPEESDTEKIDTADYPEREFAGVYSFDMRRQSSGQRGRGVFDSPGGTGGGLGQSGDEQPSYVDSYDKDLDEFIKKGDSEDAKLQRNKGVRGNRRNRMPVVGRAPNAGLSSP